jgi:hypothetical protein
MLWVLPGRHVADNKQLVQDNARFTAAKTWAALAARVNTPLSEQAVDSKCRGWTASTATCNTARCRVTGAVFNRSNSQYVATRLERCRPVLWSTQTFWRRSLCHIMDEAVSKATKAITREQWYPCCAVTVVTVRWSVRQTDRDWLTLRRTGCCYWVVSYKVAHANATIF